MDIHIKITCVKLKVRKDVQLCLISLFHIPRCIIDRIIKPPIWKEIWTISQTMMITPKMSYFCILEIWEESKTKILVLPFRLVLTIARALSTMDRESPLTIILANKSTTHLLGLFQLPIGTRKFRKQTILFKIMTKINWVARASWKSAKTKRSKQRLIILSLRLWTLNPNRNALMFWT